jgi:hypothetical protein
VIEQDNLNRLSEEFRKAHLTSCEHMRVTKSIIVRDYKET